MKNSLKYKFQKLRVVNMSFVILVFVNCLNCFGAIVFLDESKVFADFIFTCTQNEHEFILKTRISHWTGERDVPLSGATVVYTSLSSNESQLLETIPTDINGNAVFRITKESNRLLKEEGNFTFESVFEGNQHFEPAEDISTIRPLTMRLVFREVDSVKTVVVEAFEVDENSDRIPLDAMDVYFFVPRSFSLLPVGDGWFEDGSTQFDFPTTLPGDSVGNLTIIARIEDHELYGNVEVMAVKDWGLARPPVIIEKRRGLGDTDAPLWMVYTLIILLSIVWFHYLYVFYVMIKIKRLRSN